MQNLLEYVINTTRSYLENFTKATRKHKGQFFTSFETASYMASMFSSFTGDEIRILDPGAGTGILSAAVVERLQKNDGLKAIHLTCYETDENVLPILHANILYLQSNSDIPLYAEIVKSNFVLDLAEEFAAGKPSNTYDWVIMNPPYKRLPKSEPEGKAMSSICWGSPNLYFLFMALGMFQCTGEMVCITPRSWTTGSYYRKFRDYILDVGGISQIHMFANRNNVFDMEEVLQETMITKMVKGHQPAYVQVTTSNANFDVESKVAYFVSYETILYNGYVLPVTCKEDEDALLQIRNAKDTFETLGLWIHTGPVVDFREKAFLRDTSADGYVPVIEQYNIRDGKVVFPSGKKDRWCDMRRLGLMLRNQNFLFIKRYTTNEEKKRLQCAPYFASENEDLSCISAGNKVSFVTGEKLQDDAFLVHLFEVLNSDLYERYYRILGLQVLPEDTGLLL